MRLIRDEYAANTPLSIERMCKLLSVSRAAFYRWQIPKTDKSPGSRFAILKIALRRPWYGYRRIAHDLRRIGQIVNEKRVRRIMREEGLVAQSRSSKRLLRGKAIAHERFEVLPRDFVAMAVDELWVSDFTYIRFRSMFVFVAIVLDAFSRCVVGWSFATNMGADLTIAALIMAIRDRRPKPGIRHHSDGGSQYKDERYVEILDAFGFVKSMSRPGTPTDNAICERFMRTLKHEEILVNEYADLSDLERSIGRFIDDYNRRRLHSALGYVPPKEFEAAALEEHLRLSPV